MSTLIQKHRGRVVDSPGDNLLAEFGSVVDAVRCAVEVQEELRVKNAELPKNRRMVFRIGVNLGDVVEEEERIYGDGVNVATSLIAARRLHEAVPLLKKSMRHSPYLINSGTCTSWKTLKSTLLVLFDSFAMNGKLMDFQ
jgi:hypothetical protein